MSSLPITYVDKKHKNLKLILVEHRVL